MSTTTQSDEGLFLRWCKVRGLKPTKRDSGHGYELPGELMMGVTHPTIHVDYYEWRNNLNECERKTFEGLMQNPNALLLWAWTRSRETLAAKIKG